MVSMQVYSVSGFGNVSLMPCIHSLSMFSSYCHLISISLCHLTYLIPNLSEVISQMYTMVYDQLNVIKGLNRTNQIVSFRRS